MKQTTRRSFLKAAAVLSATAPAAAASAHYLVPSTPLLHAAEAVKRQGDAMIKVSCCAYSLRSCLSGKNKSMDMDGFLVWAAETGLEAAELTSYYFPQDITPDALHRIKHHAFLLGLDVSGTAVGNNFCLPPGDTRKKQIEYVKQWIDNAVHLGAPCIRIFGGRKPRGASDAEGLKWTIEATKEACRYAGEKGIFLALENHGGITKTSKEVLRIFDGVDSPWFGLNFDSGNFRTEDPYEDLKNIAPYSITAHIKVEMHPAGKEKQLCDYDKVFSILKEAGYRGYVALEYEAAGDPKSESARQIALLQKAARKS